MNLSRKRSGVDLAVGREALLELPTLLWLHCSDAALHGACALGLALGNLLAIVSVWPLRDGLDLTIVGEGMEWFGAASVLYPALKLNDLLLADAVVVVLGILTSLMPAWRASRYRPVDAIART